MIFDKNNIELYRIGYETNIEVNGVFILKVRKKVFAIILVLLLISIIVICIISKVRILGDIKHQENEITTHRVNHINFLINNEMENLSSITSDWSAWDDTLQFVRDNNSRYIQSNFNDATFNNLKINTLIILDRNNKIRYSDFYDTENKKTIETPKELLNYINDKKKILFSNNVHATVSGIIFINGRAMMLSARPITDSEYKAPSSGTVVVGKYLNYNLVSEIEKITDSKLSIEKINKYRVSDKLIIVNDGDLTFSNEDDIVIERKSKSQIVAYSIIKGIDGTPEFIMKVDDERAIYNQQIKSLSVLILLFISSTSIIWLLCIKLLKVFVIIPVESLSKEVSKINLSNNNITRVSIVGKDEISELGTEINNMLEKIEMNNKKVIESEKQLKLVLEGANAGFWDWDLENNIFNANEKFLGILGYETGDLPQTSEFWQKVIHEEEFEYWKSFFYNSLLEALDMNMIELRLMTKQGEYKWILNQCKVVKYNKYGQPKRMTGIVTDISEKKKYEEELKYLTYYDKLTGIFNRGYYEFILEKMNNKGKLPISIIMGDLNGLKITNDTFGHEEGDKLLKKTADILKKICDGNSVISRYGGDEFIILLEKVNAEEADKICLKIKDECQKKRIGSIYLNIALGYSTKVNKDQDINEVIKEAEEMMYRNKLLEDRSARNSIISSLIQTLSEKSNETEEHVNRMYNLCVRISDILNLSTNEVNELCLLAKLHDIGKIGIDDKILNKPGKLSEEEWVIMKTHTEIGYRIASSTPDLRHIAYKILTHHERYDGTGYPKGLKGDEIPLLSRILAIVDSFDVMTNDRPYKKAMTVEDAIVELKKCSGTQFDPELVGIFIEAIGR